MTRRTGPGYDFVAEEVISSGLGNEIVAASMNVLSDDGRRWSITLSGVTRVYDIDESGAPQDVTSELDGPLPPGGFNLMQSGLRLGSVHQGHDATGTYIWRNLGTKTVAVDPYIPPSATVTATATGTPTRSHRDWFWYIFLSVFGFLNLVIIALMIYYGVKGT